MKRPVAVHLPAARAAEGARLIGAAELPAELPPDGVRIVHPIGLGSSYNHALRKRAVPYALLLGDMPLRLIEWRMFKGAYKGVTDFVTKWLWPWPAVWVTRWCAAARISPNMVTAASFVLVLLALWLFALGYFELGLIAAWLMTFLDTVDGKLARVTLTSSKWGNVFDHGIDLIHPPFWYFGWYFGIAAAGPWSRRGSPAPSGSSSSATCSAVCRKASSSGASRSRSMPGAARLLRSACSRPGAIPIWRS